MIFANLREKDRKYDNEKNGEGWDRMSEAQ
jgi:hypothetical protein